MMAVWFFAVGIMTLSGMFIVFLFMPVFFVPSGHLPIFFAKRINSESNE